MELTALFFSFLAGVLSTLSPCVLPILPIIILSSLHYNWRGLASLICGISLSFALTGSLISYSAMLWDFDIDIIKTIGAVLLLIFGLVMVIEKLNFIFITLMARLTSKGNEKIATFDASGKLGQLTLGLLLGFVWTPCVGPTLGAAISLAIQGESLVLVFISMSLFGIGAGLPLLTLGLLSGKAINKGKITKHVALIKKVLGACLIVLSILILAGYDKSIETALVQWMPEWLNDISSAL